MENDGTGGGLLRIPARNRRQTMDWALVLASQGIAATIVHDADGPGWGLLVAPADLTTAQEAIRLYRIENRYWHWRQPLVWQGVVFDWKVSFWGLLVVAVFFLTHTSRPDLAVAGRMDNAAVQAGEWWRLFTAMLLHADPGHLAMNVGLGMVLLGFTMGRYGPGIGLLGAYLAGAGGNVAGWLLYPATHLGVGASGMVLGGLGMLAAQSVSAQRRNPVAQAKRWRGIVAGGLLFVLFGLSPEPNVDVIAHAGGFVTGFLLGSVWVRVPGKWQRSKMDVVAGVVLVGVIGLTCWLAWKGAANFLTTNGHQ